MIRLVGIGRAIKANIYGFSKGMPLYGDEYIKVETVEEAKKLKIDAFIQTNILKNNFHKNNSNKGSIYEYILKTGKPFLVAESASFRQYPGWRRLGWYSYKWTDGLFGNENSPPDRWNKFEAATGIRFKDWHSPGDNIIIMGQKEGDSSLNELYKKYKGFYSWVEDIITRTRVYTDRPIIIRPHPRNRARGELISERIASKYINVTVDKNENVLETLQQAYCVITYNSLSAIESITEGVPTFAFNDGSMIWPVAHKDISQIENLNYDIDLTQWKYDIAYTQWLPTEHKTGESWAHLKPLVFK